MPRTIGMVWIFGYNNLKPSTADATEIGGVMMPSARRVLPSENCGNCQPSGMLSYQCVQSENASFATVIGPEDQNNVFDGCLEGERPEYAGQRTIDNLFGYNLTSDNRLHYIEWRRTYIAVYNAERHQ